jgi:hypothetical protein
MGETVILPPTYYHTYFQEILEVVASRHAHLLAQAEQLWIAAYHTLPLASQCLYLRMMNRKGLYFRVRSLQYPEIPGLEAAMQHLCEKGFVQAMDSHWQEDIEAVLGLFTKKELLALFQPLMPGGTVLAALNKPLLLETLQQVFTSQELMAALLSTGPLVARRFHQETEMIGFLYFGTLAGSITNFVLRDVGHVKLEAADPGSFLPYFHTRLEAEAALELEKAYIFFRAFRHGQLLEDFFPQLQAWLQQAPLSEYSHQSLFHQLIAKAGLFLEKNKCYPEALEVYGYSQGPVCRERSLRLLKKLGRRAEAQSLCEQVLLAPASPDEHLAAQDLLAQLQAGKSRPVRTVTQRLRNAEHLVLSSTFQGMVEHGVLHWQGEQGGNGFYAENYLWRNLLGLVLWEVIFDSRAGGYHHPLQYGPADLYSPAFLPKRMARVQQQLEILQQPEEALAYIRKIYQSKTGTTNTLVGWHPDTLSQIAALLAQVEGEKLGGVLWQMLANLGEFGKGFPDLFLWGENGYHFAEVKSPNDTLSAHQVFWLDCFDRLGIAVKVYHVQWEGA